MNLPLPQTIWTMGTTEVIKTGTIGQDPDLHALASRMSSHGKLLAVDGRQASGVDGVWAGGDVASMARFASEAVGMGQRAAIDIDRVLRGAEGASDSALPVPVGLASIATYYHPHQPRAVEARRPAALLVSELLSSGDSQKPMVVAYRKGYEEKFKADVSTFGGHAYDGLMLAMQAIRAAGTTDKAKVRDALEATRAYVGTGGVVNMSAVDHMGLDLGAFRMLEVKDGNWSLVR